MPSALAAISDSLTCAGSWRSASPNAAGPTTGVFGLHRAGVTVSVGEGGGEVFEGEPHVTSRVQQGAGNRWAEVVCRLSQGVPDDDEAQPESVHHRLERDAALRRAGSEQVAHLQLIASERPLLRQADQLRLDVAFGRPPEVAVLA